MKEGAWMFDNPNSIINLQPMFLIMLVIIAIFILIYVVVLIFRNPFSYPYFSHSFDITGKRNVNLEDYIDNFLRDEKKWIKLQTHQYKIQEWKKQTENYTQTCRMSKYRTKQYQNVLDDNNAYHFIFVRKQTRYKQQNYVKTSYKVLVADTELKVSWQWLTNRRNQLEKIGFEATLREYNSNSQRKLMTKALRKTIMERDNYTCQSCGKYMPDEVGLHIDHIIPIAKGGKSIPSNLRVLCSKCNGSKGSK